MPALDTQINVAVIGAGAMGSGIAQVAAQAGHTVYLHDQREGAAEAGREGIAKQLQRRVDKGKMEQESLDAVIGRIHPVANLNDIADAGLVIEAIIEDLKIKRELLANLEELCASDAILACEQKRLPSSEPRPDVNVGVLIDRPDSVDHI